MSLQVEKLEKNMAKLTIEVDAAKVTEAIKKAYDKNKGKMSVPGFRKGKVPQAMIEKMYGPEVFYEDAANFIIPDAYEKELAENREIEVVSQPSIDVTQCEKGKSFIFTAEVALKPEIELGKYKGVKIDKIETDVTDEEVDKEIEKEREANSRTITVTDRPVKDKDMTIIDFEGFVDGEAFEGGKGENYHLTIGSGSFIPGFEDQLIGAKIDEETEVKVTFPEDYHAEELKGKDAVFKVTVHEIKEKELPDLDDEFASEVSEFDTLKEYKEDVRKKLLEKKETEARRQREDAVIEAIVKDSRMDIPDAMIDTQTRQMAQDYAGRLQQQGLTLDQYFKFTGMDMDKFLEQMRPGAQKRIESRLVLEAVAKAENFEISDEEFDHEIDRMAEMYQMEADKLKDLMGDYEKDQIIEDLKIQKAVDYVTENCKESKPRSTKKKEAAD